MTPSVKYELLVKMIVLVLFGLVFVGHHLRP